MKKGLIICLEGIDGSGKTTVANEIVRRYRASGQRARYEHEPTRRVLRHVGDCRSVEERILLYAADRAMHLNRDVLPLAANGCVVVLDRCFYSTLAYQPESMTGSHLRAASYGVPDWFWDMAFHVLLDCDPAVASGRAKGDGWQDGDIEHLVRVRENYLEIGDRFGDAERGGPYDLVIRTDRFTLHQVVEQIMVSVALDRCATL